MRVATSGDICRHYGIKPCTLVKWRRSPGFPPAILEPEPGQAGLWDAALIEAWYEGRSRRPGPQTMDERERPGRVVECILTYRRTGNIHEAGRRSGLGTHAARRLLIARGEHTPKPRDARASDT